MLALARLDEGVGPARREVDAAAFLREAVEAAPGGAGLGEVAAGRIEADPDMVARVIRNLVENARRHAGRGGTVMVSSIALGGRLRIEVDDDGPGIAPAERERVFDRFHRSDEARPRRRRRRARPGDRPRDRRRPRRQDLGGGVAARRRPDRLRAAGAAPRDAKIREVSRSA